jgi:hypothetical protein
VRAITLSVSSRCEVVSLFGCAVRRRSIANGTYTGASYDRDRLPESCIVTPMIWPDWIDPLARELAEIYAERIFAGDEDSLVEAVELAGQAAELRQLPEVAS